MKYAKNIIDLIGNTPLIKINTDYAGRKHYATILAKLEYYNPGSSVKDRIAKNMIEQAEKQGLIKKDTVIIEPTSGNTGIGLAMVCAAKNYKLILTMPESMSTERKILLKAYGAELVLTPASEGMSGAIKKAQELKGKYPNSFVPQQFENIANYQAHENTTAQEIWQDTEGQIDILVAGVGTGGTITGISKYIKSQKPEFKSIAVEPAESAVLSGELPAPHKIQGIGAGFVPKILDLNIIDEVKQVSSQEAISIARYIASNEGILTGISAGAALKVSMDLASQEINKGKVIVVIIPSNGERYLSSVLFEKEREELN